MNSVGRSVGAPWWLFIVYNVRTCNVMLKLQYVVSFVVVQYSVQQPSCSCINSRMCIVVECTFILDLVGSYLLNISVPKENKLCILVRSEASL